MHENLRVYKAPDWSHYFPYMENEIQLRLYGDKAVIRISYCDACHQPIRKSQGIWGYLSEHLVSTDWHFECKSKLVHEETEVRNYKEHLKMFTLFETPTVV